MDIMMKKQYLFLGLLFTLTLQVQSNIFGMLPEENKLSSESRPEVTMSDHDYVSKQLGIISAEAAQEKKNGPTIISALTNLKEYLLFSISDRTSEIYEELLQYVVKSLLAIKENHLEKQNNRIMVIKSFNATIKSLNEKLKQNKNQNINKNKNNNNGASQNASKLPVLLPIKNMPARMSHVPQARHVPQNINFIGNNNNNNNNDHDVLMSTEDSYFDFNINQSELSRKLWGNLALHKRDELRKKMYTYRSILNINRNDEGNLAISVDEKMPMTPLIASIMLSNTDDVCMLIDAGVDCQMPAGNGEMPIVLATECFMNWSQNLERVFFKLFEKTRMNSLIAEQIIKKILIRWRSVGDSYLNPHDLNNRPPHASRTIFLFILEHMRKNNIRFNNTELIYPAIETIAPVCLEYIVERFDENVDFCTIGRRVGNIQKQLLVECIDQDVTFCMIKPLLKSGKFNKAYSINGIDHILKNLPKLKSATFPETLYEVIDALLIKEEVSKTYDNGDTLFHKMILNIKNLSDCFKGSGKYHWNDLIFKLIDLGANPSAQNKLGETPLHKLLIVSGPIEKKFNEDADFRIRFKSILGMLFEKTDDRLTDVFKNSAKSVKATLKEQFTDEMMNEL